jgi:DNA-directed RNA polymerase specialized sigma24 family protein
LLEWLDDGIDSHGENYLEMRRRLVAYFDRRNRTAADELADETLNRVAKTLEAEGEIVARPPARYCYAVARFVLLEDFRRDRKHVALDPQRGADPSRSSSLSLVSSDSGAVLQEQRLESLDRCLEALRPEQRELVIEYYRDAHRERIERRRRLADRLGISMNALGIRACRIRDQLMTCMEASRAGRRTI